MKSLLFTALTLLSLSAFADNSLPLVNGKYVFVESTHNNSSEPLLKCEESVEVLGPDSHDFRNLKFSGVTVMQREFDFDGREAITFFNRGVQHTKLISHKLDIGKIFSPTIKVTMRNIFIQQGDQLLMIKNRIKTRGLFLERLSENSSIECIYNKVKS